MTDNRFGTTWLLRGVNYPMERLAVSGTRGELRAVLQDHDVFAVEPRLELFDPVHIDDRRAMHAHEVVRREPLLEACERVPDDVRLTSRVQPGVLSVRLDPIDLTRPEKRNLAGCPNHEAVDRPLIEQRQQPAFGRTRE